MKYFTEKEFKCQEETCFEKMNKSLIEMLDVAREVAGVPFKINSSWRSKAWNDMIGGSRNSSHMRGNAVDIACTSSQNRLLIVEALLTAGFTRIGIANTFIHCDIDEALPQNVIFLYK